ncbi:HTH-type transcriptional repressor KstR2 [Neobacillus rhizosphaerae]|uniref:HTH-type transcriptional repressor KstR2 n=1 Tax=Neobacillus rhizosphaerae TaxID=2880965 RepID=A0ABN8KVT3_9BACI|nr:TetR/AcrR family transcriptional regulator [Neobacillus rhizosphaerae]CAH2716565.1 HTH-type transcriptional repressor KstR2 [Neobacillus rhizosphaerae]
MLSTGEKIVQASLRLFAQKGFEATSIRDIALESGINSATLYYYIKSKDDFLISIMNDELEGLIKNASEIVSTLTTPEQQIAGLVQMHVMAHGVHQLSMLVTDTEFRALHGENKVKIRNLRKKYEQIWTEVISNGEREGRFQHVEDPKLSTLAVLTMCTGVVHWYSPKGKKSLVTISENYTNMVLHLLGAKIEGKALSIHDLNLHASTKYYSETDGSDEQEMMM